MVVVVLVPGIYAHVVGEKGDEKWTDMGNEEREEWKIVGKEENGIKWTDMVKEEAKIGRWLTSCSEFKSSFICSTKGTHVQVRSFQIYCHRPTILVNRGIL